MSRHYEMNILVKGFDAQKKTDIEAAIEGEWNISDSWNEDGGILYAGNDNLVGGEDEAEFSSRVRNAIWKANGEFCEIEIRCIYLDVSPPTECYVFDEDDYAEWKKVQ